MQQTDTLQSDSHRDLQVDQTNIVDPTNPANAILGNRAQVSINLQHQFIPMNPLVAENILLKRKVNELEALRANLADRLLQSEAERQRDRREHLEALLSAQRDLELSSLQLRDTVASEQERSAQLELHVQSVERANEALQKENESLKRQVNELNNIIRELRERLQSTQTQLNAMKKELHETKDTLFSTNNTLSSVQKELQVIRDSFSSRECCSMIEKRIMMQVNVADSRGKRVRRFDTITSAMENGKGKVFENLEAKKNDLPSWYLLFPRLQKTFANIKVGGNVNAHYRVETVVAAECMEELIESLYEKSNSEEENKTIREFSQWLKAQKSGIIQEASEKVTKGDTKMASVTSGLNV